MTRVLTLALALLSLAPAFAQQAPEATGRYRLVHGTFGESPAEVDVLVFDTHTGRLYALRGHSHREVDTVAGTTTLRPARHRVQSSFESREATTAALVFSIFLRDQQAFAECFGQPKPDPRQLESLWRQLQQPAQRTRLLNVLEARIAEQGDAFKVVGIPAAVSEVECASQLRQLALAVIQYSDDKRTSPADASGTLKGVLRDLRAGGYLDTQPRCPVAVDEGDCGYRGLRTPHPRNVRSTVALAWCAEAHPDGKRNVVFFDGTVRSLTTLEFQQLLVEQSRD